MLNLKMDYSEKLAAKLAAKLANMNGAQLLEFCANEWAEYVDSMIADYDWRYDGEDNYPGHLVEFEGPTILVIGMRHPAAFCEFIMEMLSGNEDYFNRKIAKIDREIMMPLVAARANELFGEPEDPSDFFDRLVKSYYDPDIVKDIVEDIEDGRC